MSIATPERVTTKHDVFESQDGVQVRRMSDSLVSVGGIPYILPVPESRTRVDRIEAWLARMEQMTAVGSVQRHRAVVEFLTLVEPDPS